MIQQIMHPILLFFQGILIIFIAPLLMGWNTQVKCRLQQRSGPSLFQRYFIFYKLLFKKPVIAYQASWLFRFAPYLYFTSLATVCFSLPFLTTDAFAGHFMDMIVFVGLLALGRVILVLAAMDIGTAFGSLGARRELFVACLAEPILLIVFYNMVLLTKSPYLSSSAAHLLQYPLLYPSLLFSLLAIFLITLAETGRVPVDNPATHLELTMIHEAMILEYSGRYLALIEWGNAIKFIVYSTLIVILFIPFGLTNSTKITWLGISLLITFIKLFLLAAFIAFIESINSKLRLFKISNYLTSALMLAVLGVFITVLLRTT